jgi:hypothetical protein
MSRFSARNLDRIGRQLSVPIKIDDDGYLGRECPVKECLGYFKITPGTGVKSRAPCHCPYCGHSGDQNTFWTQEQLDYATSVALRRVTDAIHQDLKSLEFDHRPVGPFGLGISLKVKAGRPHPINYYREKQLETEVACDNCTLRYAIYGVFGWCPDCGVHNSLQILIKNLELARKELSLAATVDPELANHLIGDALENAVSAFDGFGRQLCERKATEIRFQNLASARRKVQDAFGFDFADALRTDEWETACRAFQKRHLLAHKMGVIDDDYIQKANDASAVSGRKLALNRREVETYVQILESMGRRLFAGIFP